MPLNDVSPGSVYLTKLFDQLLGSPAASFDTGATIDAGFTSLVLELCLRSDEVVTLAGANITFNNDTGTNYERNYMRSQNSVMVSTQNTANASNQLALVVGGSGAANTFGHSHYEILNYDQTTQFKIISGWSTAFYTPGTTNTFYLDTAAGHWRSTAAINRVAVGVSTGGKNFQAGSRMTLWGKS